MAGNRDRSTLRCRRGGEVNVMAVEKVEAAVRVYLEEKTEGRRAATADMISGPGGTM